MVPAARGMAGIAGMTGVTCRAGVTGMAGMTGMDVTSVPYKSGPAAMTDLIGGQVMMFTADFGVMLPQVKGGKVRGLAVTSTKRSAAIPELPTVNEALGLKDYELIAYFAMFAPAGTPADIIAKLNTEIVKIVKLPEIQARLIELGLTPTGTSAAALDTVANGDYAFWNKVINDLGIKVD